MSKPLGGGLFDAEHAVASSVKAVQLAAWVGPVYAIGVLASVYHLANGMWTMGITWGVWTGPRSQRWASVFCLGIGLALGMAGMAALYGFWAYHIGS